jgi:uncharacterized 2Fe-2S/4Fe-4S cluster protein (DUF4445 family)
MNYFEVFFQHANKTVHVEEETLLSDACKDAGYPIDLVCGGKGTCGKCKVLIKKNGSKETVLACTYRIKESITIYLSEKNLSKSSLILTEGKLNIIFQPSIVKKYIELKTIYPDHCGSYFEKIKSLLNCEFSYPLIKKTGNILAEDNLKGLTFVMDGNNAIDVQKNDVSNTLYGAAVDIGTTTVVMYLYDLISGTLLGTYSELNKQISKGADVINRIMHCVLNDKGTEELQIDIISTINEMIDKALNEYPEIKDNLYHIALCGNNTMQHLFHGFNPQSLGNSPFASVCKDLIITKGYETGLNTPENCTVHFLPLIAGFVGGDTTSALISLPQDNQLRLIADLGTNGEIAVGREGSYITASTACGPALEGAGIEFGMRGIDGAIEKFEIENEALVFSVIGNVAPKGICGSGIIDIIAELIKHGIVDNTGKILKKEEFESKYPQSKLSTYIVEYNGLAAFKLCDSIFVTQKDIRQIQLAKSAIYTGCTMLISDYGIKGEELDEICLAGAFGNYINIKNAQYIGMLPRFNNVSTFSLGNAAGTGVQNYLLNKNELFRCKNIASTSRHIELASDAKFQELYISHMNF